MLVYPPRDEVGETLGPPPGARGTGNRLLADWLAGRSVPRASRTFAGGGTRPTSGLPKANWRRYDDLVRLASDRGVQVNFDLGPRPVTCTAVWAATPCDRGRLAPVRGRGGGALLGAYTPPPGEQKDPPPRREPDPLPASAFFPQ